MKVYTRTMNKSYSLSSLIIFLVASAGVHCLKLIGLSVPSWVKRGDEVWLNCTLEYEEEVLYSIKWYKNDVEFYRYLPKDMEKNQIYEYSGVYVNLPESDKGQVNLYKTDLDTEGSYRCEASNDGPTFQTVEAVKELKIYELPENNLTISGLLPSYDVGDVINATCEAGPSKPAAKLTWFIDDEPVTSAFEESYTVTKNEDGLESSSSNLSFVLSEEYSHKDTISVKCIATVSIYDSTSNEELIMDDKNSTVKTELNATEGPKITGGQHTYRTGDLVNLTCISPKSSLPSKLQWYINDVKAPPEQVISYPNDLSNESQTMLGLTFYVEPIHFDSKIKCTSIVSPVIDTRSEVKVVENRRSQFGFENRGADSVIANDMSGSANHIMPRTEALLLLLLLPFL